MTRVHDMGGRFGDGAVIPEPGDEVFHEDWHARALAMTLACGALGRWNIDVSRFARESVAPVDYARFTYYEKWLAGLAGLLVGTELVSRAELSGEEPDTQHPLAELRLAAADVPTVTRRGGPTDRDSSVAQCFDIGDAVRTRRLTGNRLVEGGHSRLPRYAAGATGRIHMTHGAHVLPDSNAHGMGEAPEPLYTVVFAASELWVNPEHPGDEVTLDLWQSYLEPAS